MLLQWMDIEQDGADFWSAGSGSLLVTAPFEFCDGDLEAAKQARAWFIENWCPANNIDPEFL